MEYRTVDYNLEIDQTKILSKFLIIPFFPQFWPSFPTFPFFREQLIPAPQKYESVRGSYVPCTSTVLSLYVIANISLGCVLYNFISCIPYVLFVSISRRAVSSALKVSVEISSLIPRPVRSRRKAVQSWFANTGNTMTGIWKVVACWMLSTPPCVMKARGCFAKKKNNILTENNVIWRIQL